ncbi:MAG TPA: ATP-binding protein [Patescibacteria group bacterium]|nr:ATP-binding protein [Patescibacteria group bacterium]
MKTWREAPAGHRPGEGGVGGPILVPFVLVLVFVVAVFVVGAVWLQDRSEREAADQGADAVQNLLHLQLDRDAGLMHATVDAMTNDAVLRDAMRHGDREALLRRVQPLFAELRDKHRITHLSFIRANRAMLVRVHEPDREDDGIDRGTMLDEATRGAPSYGLDLGDQGRLTLRSVMAWRDHDTLIGFVELGEDIAPMANDIHGVLGVDLLVTVQKEYLQRDKWEDAGRQENRQGNWDQLPFSVATAQTVKALPPALIPAVLQGPYPRKAEITTEAGHKVLMVSVLPLIDVAQRVIGNVVILRDITAAQQVFYRAMVLVVALSALAGVVVFILFLAVLDGVARNERKARRIERQYLHLSDAHGRIVEAELAKAFDQIAHRLAEPMAEMRDLAGQAEQSVGSPGQLPPLLSRLDAVVRTTCGLVRRIRDFASIPPVQVHPVTLQTLVLETVSQFQQTVPGAAVEFDLPEEPVMIEADAALLRQALLALLTNAAQAASADLPIGVALRSDPTLDQDGWSLSVSDRGPGLADDVAERLFVPFFSTRADGSGLGLATARRIAALHGGHISVAHHTDGGAELAIWLPSQPVVMDQGEAVSP